MKERKLGLLGKKIGMTQIWTEEGTRVGVTVIELGPNLVLNKRSKASNANGRTDGYTALQLGYDKKPARKLNKPESGLYKDIGGDEAARRFVREVRVSEETLSKHEVGTEISLADLEWSPGELVDITGRSKGRGFAGVMKRHNFAGFPATHGTHEYFRHGGSIGCRKWPGRVFKGRKMPGHYGDKRITTQNLKIAQIRGEENLLLVRGAVPGPKNGYVMVRPAIKKNPLP
ncbi:MAG: 50S ribosomal protein L3 [Myxococcota bacterium]